MINEGNLKRYSIYAFGEILLVMVGILLALQVNTWNEGRKKDKEANFYLNRIATDLKTDIIETEETLESHQLRIRLILEILEAFGESTINSFNCDVVQTQIKTNELPQIPPRTNSSINLSSFSGKLSYIVRARQFDLSDMAFQELISTGKIDVISDQILKKKIQSHYRNIGETISFQRFIAEARSDYRKVLLDYGISNLNEYTQERVKGMISDPQTLITTLKNYLDLTCRTIRVLFFQDNSIKFSSQKLIVDIEEYLAKTE